MLIQLLLLTLLQDSTKVESGEVSGKVAGIADGDTITILTAEKKQIKIRFNGIDAQERGQPFGTKSKEFVSGLIGEKSVRVVTHGEDRQSVSPMSYPLASFPRFGVSQMATVCSRCNAKLGWIASTLSAGSTDALCPACVEESLETSNTEDADLATQVIQQTIQLSKSVKVTTTPAFDGYRVVEYLGIESVEFVIGTGMFSEVSSSLADFFGARSSAFEQKLQAAKRHAMDALKYIAAKRGANAVLAIDLDYTEFSGNRIALIINGTLVRIEQCE